MGSPCGVQPNGLSEGEHPTLFNRHMRGGNVVIINLQKTPIDDMATLCIYGKCDDVIELVMKKLKMQIPVW